MKYFLRISKPLYAGVVASLFIALSWYAASAQSVSEYLFSASVGTYTEITGGTLVSNSTTLDNEVFNGQNIGFTFNYNGADYTQISIATKGFIVFGATGSTSTAPLSGNGSNNVISALGGDLRSQAGSTIRTQVTGSAPNRVMTIQWRNFRWDGASGDSYHFQIRLHETTHTIQLVYGNFTKNGTQRNVQVGLRGASNADYHNRTSTTDWPATTKGNANNATVRLRQSSPTVLPSSGLTYTFRSPYLWIEDFDLPNGTAQDAGPTAWSSSYSGPGSFSVQGGSLVAENTMTEAVWESEVIDISATNYAEIDLSLTKFVNNGSRTILLLQLRSEPDYLRFYYKIDGGPEVLFHETISNGVEREVDTENLSKVLKGNTLQIVLRFQTTPVESRICFIVCPSWDVVLNDYYSIDHISVKEVATLYSRASGNWRNGNNWSVNDFSKPQPPAGFYPSSSEVAIIGNGNTITLNNNEESALMEVRNSGNVNLNQRTLSMRRGGDVWVESGGAIQNNNVNSIMVFSDPHMISNLVIDENNGLDIGRVMVNANVNLHIAGPGDLSINNDLVFNGTNASIDIDGTTVSIGGNVVGNQNNQIINRGVLHWSGQQWGVRLFSSAPGAIFRYDAAGFQNVVTPQDGYHHLTFSGSGTKRASGSISVNGNITLDDDAILDVNNNNLTLQGHLTMNSTAGQPVTGIARLTLNGASPQYINGASTAEIDMAALTVDLPGGGEVMLSKPLRITGANSAFTNGIVRIISSDVITFTDGATVVNSGNANSFVDGRVEKIGNDAFTFPTGNGAYWAPIQISGLQNFQNATRFSAEYTFSLPPNTSLIEAGMSHISTLEHWNLSRVADPGNDAACYVTLHFPDQERSQITDVADLVVAHYNSSASVWENLGGANISGSTVRSQGRVSDFSPFTLGSLGGNNSLPVELKDFSARYMGDEVRVRWSTLTELNNDYFTIEHSLDGIHFTEIGRVQGYGTTNEPQQYEFFDTRYSAGINYYRLRQTDFDGTEETFRPVYVDIETAGWVSDVMLYPNPVSASAPVIHLNMKAEMISGEPTEIVILNHLGQQVNRHLISSDSPRSNVAINLGAGTKSGIYILKIIAGESVLTRKFMVQ